MNYFRSEQETNPDRKEDILIILKKKSFFFFKWLILIEVRKCVKISTIANATNLQICKDGIYTCLIIVT